MLNHFWTPASGGRGPLKLPLSVRQLSVGHWSVFFRNGSWNFPEVLHKVWGSYGSKIVSLKKNPHFGENSPKLLQNKVFWLLLNIVSINMSFFILKMVHNIVMILWKSYDWEKSVFSLWPKMLSTNQIIIWSLISLKRN